MNVLAERRDHWAHKSPSFLSHNKGWKQAVNCGCCLQPSLELTRSLQAVGFGCGKCSPGRGCPPPRVLILNFLAEFPLLLQVLRFGDLFSRSYLWCRDREGMGAVDMTRQLRVQSHRFPCKTGGWLLCCQRVWKTAAACGRRRGDWHHHFCVRDKRRESSELFLHCVAPGTWSSRWEGEW